MFNALQLIVASAHGTEDCRGLSGTVGTELYVIVSICFSNLGVIGGKRNIKTYSRLENTLVTPISLGRLANFVLSSVRVDDTVLASDLVAVPLTVRTLFFLVAAQFALEFGFDRVDLALLHVTAGIGRLVGVIR